jgi:signal peptidase I
MHRCAFGKIVALPALARCRPWLVCLLLFVAGLYLCRSAVLNLYWVSGESMQPALLEGDRIVVNRLAYSLRAPLGGRLLATWAAPRRGDVVVLASPASGKLCVKRVAGIPGDEVAIWGPEVLVNGQPASDAPFSPISGTASSLRVPPGHCFLLGDNRDYSVDSRWYGCVEHERIIGCVVGVALSLDPANHSLPRWSRCCRRVE